MFRLKCVLQDVPLALHTRIALDAKQAMPMIIKPNYAHPALKIANHANTPQATRHFPAMAAKMATTEIVLAIVWSVARIARAAKASRITVRAVPVATS